MVDVPVERTPRNYRESDLSLPNATQKVCMDDVLGNVEGLPREASGACDVWRVQLASGELRAMTLDQLDEAFQAGLIGEETLVLPAGAHEWSKLGAIAGLDEPSPSTLRPVATEVPDLDVEPVQFRSRKRGVVLAVAAVAVLVGAVALVVTRGEEKPASTATGVPVVTESLPSAAPVSSPAPAEPAKPSLTDAQKRALLEADKVRDQQRELRKPKAAPPPRHRFKTSGTPFHEGGNKHDPLNSAL